ncbi:hypothetical protein PHYBOEH_007433 [Phytophthora boehmeriae]|uniref:PX domain-containing protein n=1 Tax=Phytophthora boehmeriae TaxID=109152 RepID=A0A8T1WBF5_9STRA|nr:hypothetical protein PHYBOEH_007433 [Phytophthora boehmeriae]
MATLSVLITGFGVVRDGPNPDCVVFLGTVQQGTGSSWTIYRPFEAFQRLGQQLSMIFGSAVPSCPPRAFDLRFPESLEKARVDLSMWMMQLLQHPPIFQSHVFVDFVSVDANVPPSGLHSAASGAAAGGEGRGNIGDLDMDEMFDSTTDDDPRSHDELHDDDMFQFDYNTDMSGAGLDPQALLEETQHQHAQQMQVQQQQQQQKRSEKVTLEDFVMIKVIGKGSFGKVLLGQVPPPWRPTFSGALDTSQFDREFTDMPVVSPDNNVRGMAMAMGRRPANTAGVYGSLTGNDPFKGFTYTEDSYLQDGLPGHQPGSGRVRHHNL